MLIRGNGAVAGAPLAWERAPKLRAALIARAIAILNKQDLKERVVLDVIGYLLPQVRPAVTAVWLHGVARLFLEETSPPLLLCCGWGFVAV